MCYCVPCWDLWLAKALSLFLHPPPPRHHDRQPSLDHLDLKSYELHSGEHFSVFYCDPLSHYVFFLLTLMQATLLLLLLI